MLRQLSAAERQIVREVMKLNEEALSSVVTFSQSDITTALAGTPLATGESLVVLHVRARVESTGQYIPVEKVTYLSRELPDRWPAVLVTSNAITPVDLRQIAGGSDTGWDEYDLLEVRLVALPAQLTALAGTLTLPDHAKDALIAHLVRFMANSSGDGVARELAGMLQSEAELTQSAIHTIAYQANMTSWYVTPRE